MTETEQVPGPETQPPLSLLLDNFYPTYYVPFKENRHFPDQVTIPLEWADGFDQVYKKTATDGRERIATISINTQTQETSFVHKDEWTGGNKSITGELVRQATCLINYQYPKGLLCFAYSKSNPVHNYITWKSWVSARTSAFLSSGDIVTLLTGKLNMPPIFAIFDKQEIIMAINPNRPLDMDLAEFNIRYLFPYLKNYSAKINPDRISKPQNFSDIFKIIYATIHASRLPNCTEFDPIKWNITMAEKFGFYLYQGNYHTLRLARIA